MTKAEMQESIKNEADLLEGQLNDVENHNAHLENNVVSNTGLKPHIAMMRTRIASLRTIAEGGTAEPVEPVAETQPEETATVEPVADEAPVDEGVTQTETAPAPKPRRRG